MPAGLNLGFLKKVSSFYTLGALANFLETQTGANILSTPNLVALDNEEAKIVVGQNVPFITGSFTHRRHRQQQPLPDRRAQGRRPGAAREERRSARAARSA